VQAFSALKLCHSPVRRVHAGLDSVKARFARVKRQPHAACSDISPFPWGGGRLPPWLDGDNETG
jgi:hypothetical protein